MRSENDQQMFDVGFDEFLKEIKYEISHLLIREDALIPDLARLQQNLSERNIKLVQVPINYEPEEKDMTPDAKWKLWLHMVYNGMC